LLRVAVDLLSHVHVLRIHLGQDQLAELHELLELLGGHWANYQIMSKNR
jgi:hypothetical protein